VTHAPAVERARAAGCPVTMFDIEHDPAFRTNLRDKWKEAAELGPIFYSEAARGFWVVSGYEEIRAALGNHEVFSSQLMMAFMTEGGSHPDLIPVSLDPPRHTKYRQLLAPLLSPPAVERRVPMMRTVCSELIDEILQRGRDCELMRDFAYRVPGRVFGTMLGMTPEQGEACTRIATAMQHTSAELQMEPAEIQAMQAEMAATIDALFERRRREPGDDIASALVVAEVDGHPLTDAELANIGALLFLAGFDTTAGAIGEILGWLAQHPEDREKLVADPAKIPAAVEESLRYNANSGVSGRLVVKPVEIAGCRFEPGDRVFFALQAADRDPDVFDWPDEMDIERSPNRQITFGLGVHRCLGAHLARAELRVAVEEWLRRVPVFRLAPGTVLEHIVTITSAFRRLPLELG
jgi:cytochrome P450